MCDYDGESATVMKKTTPVARKVHACEECHLPIPVGVAYVRVGCLFDGAWTTTIAHVECEALARDASEAVCDSRTWFHGEMKGHLAEAGVIGKASGEYEPVCAKTRRVLRRKWNAITAKYATPTR